MRSVPKGLCFIIFIAIACFSTLHAQSDSEKHPFEYTGALFGYYQINDETGKYLPPVDQFLERPRRASDGVLLGMGDNFGPEFRASIHPANIETMPNCGLPPHKRDGKVESYPQAIYKLEDRLLSPEKIDCDNVVRFLIKAHYSAIVPGREDFLYSALWLRNTALGLRHLVGAPPRMLAANLRVKWTGEGAHLKYGPINDRDPSRTVIRVSTQCIFRRPAVTLIRSACVWNQVEGRGGKLIADLMLSLAFSVAPKATFCPQ